eukprot:TRINITY_DN10620_c0_g1_i1.p1 TRINITY_DN10620_c0_g1~~TRINITY_DN10620_c0_g1_i1.p1  ORF type:complete len:497 (-),score=139.74 TRINITY_DN10620_c0_g1_i1:59-1549(-)
MKFKHSKNTKKPKNMSDIGLIGLAVMGENLVLNMESKGFSVSVFNRTTSKVKDFVEGRGAGKNIVGCYDYQELASSLAKPRKVMIMVRAGWPVDSTIEKLVEVLDEGDLIIDGGNSNYNDTNRRTKELAEKGILYMGAGVSGGEEGALLGPSIMPGGNPKAWDLVKPIFQTIAAQVDDEPCCDFVGEDGAGHFVKMVHNGIEYGDMQLIAEAYYLMKHLLGMNNEEIADTLEDWNQGELDSYLIEISRDIFRKKDEENPDAYVLDLILDAAGQKGTGKWTVISALEVGSPVTLISAAVFARVVSSMKDERVYASSQLSGPELQFDGDKEQFLNAIRDAVFAAKITSYAQGFSLMRTAAAEYEWHLNYGGIALMWRGGCIIRSAFLGKIKTAFEKQPELPNLLLDDFFKEKVLSSQDSWRQVTSAAINQGIPVPALSGALGYFDSYRSEYLPANLIQAQRDYFGAHTYERIDKPRGEYFHTNWTGRGGTTSATTYST